MPAQRRPQPVAISSARQRYGTRGFRAAPQVPRAVAGIVANVRNARTARYRPRPAGPAPRWARIPSFARMLCGSIARPSSPAAPTGTRSCPYRHRVMENIVGIVLSLHALQKRIKSLVSVIQFRPVIVCQHVDIRIIDIATLVMRVPVRCALMLPDPHRVLNTIRYTCPATTARVPRPAWRHSRTSWAAA